MKTDIENFLLKLGISPSTRGFAYMCHAIEIIVSEDMMNGKLTKITHLYERVAKERGTTRACVERCIRHAVANIDDAKRQAFLCGNKKNAEVICTIALRIQQEKRNGKYD